MNRRFMLIILGAASGIDKDLNFIADGETGVHFVDGKGMFICTFYSPYSATEIHERMRHRPAMMVFDITDNDSYGVNLPSKYYLGIFPEVQKIMEEAKEKWEPIATKEKGKLQEKAIEEVIEEYASIDEILDKLSRNNYDRKCLTEKELKILTEAK